MAQKVLVQLVDDLDGTDLGEGGGETVQFGLDGRQYEIDLSHANAKRLRTVLGEFVDAGRVAQSGRRASSGSRSSASTAGKRRDLAEVRAWARSKGHEVSDRGRIPQTILDAYDEAH